MGLDRKRCSSCFRHGPSSCIFGVICDIIVFSTDEFYLVCDLLFTDHFERHLHSYIYYCKTKDL